MSEKLAGTTTQIAERYGLNTGTLANLRNTGGGPKFYRIGSGKGRIIYFYEDIETWIRSEMDVKPKDR